MLLGTAARKPETTYDDSYKRRPHLPPKMYHQPVSIELGMRFNHTLHMLPPRQFPIQPCGPKTKVLQIEQAPGFGLGTHTNMEKFLDPKPIVRSHQPAKLFEYLQKSRPKSAKKRNFLPLTKEAMGEMSAEMKKEIDRAIISSYMYSTTTQRAGEAGAMPCSEVPPPENTLEVNADLVKYRPQRYEKETGMWQSVGLDWDKIQSRPPISHFLREDSTKNRPRPFRGPVSLEKRKADNMDVTREIRSLLEKNEINPLCERKCPRYAGFVPRTPIESCSLSKKRTTMISCMNESYRPYPLNPFSVPADFSPVYAHKSPLSKAVTLTYPYNAFNNGSRKPLKSLYHI